MVNFVIFGEYFGGGQHKNLVINKKELVSKNKVQKNGTFYTPFN